MSPSSVLGRNVEHGSSRSRAQSIWQWKKQSTQFGRPLRLLLARRRASPIASAISIAGPFALFAPITSPRSPCLAPNAPIMSPSGERRRARLRKSPPFWETPDLDFRPLRKPETAPVKLSPYGTGTDSQVERVAAPLWQSLSRLLLADPPVDPRDHLRTRGWRGRLARRRRGLRAAPVDRIRRPRASDLDAHRVLAPPARLPLGAGPSGRQPPSLHHPWGSPRPSE